MADDLYAQAKALNGLAYASVYMPEKQSMGLQYHSDALEYWRLLDDRRGKVTTLVALGHLTSFIGEKQQALAYYLEAEPSVSNCGEPATVATLCAGLGFVYESMGQLQTALQYYLKALSSWQEAKYRIAEAESLTKIGRLYGQLGESAQALDYLLRARLIAQSLSDPSTEALVLTYMGEVYAAVGHEAEALTSFQEALTERAHAKNWVRVRALIGVGKIYQKRGACRTSRRSCRPHESRKSRTRLRQSQRCALVA
jgi:tetratricopeptide (TPR) repeat protein